MRRNIATWYLTDDEAARLYREHPQLKASADKFCPTCNTTGKYTWKGEEHRCDCVMQLQLHKHYLAAGIGVAYQRLSWEDFEGDPDLKVDIEIYLSRYEHFIGKGVGLLLWGDYGTGKTFAATLLLKELVKLGYRCYSTTFASMVEMFTAGWKSVDDQRFFQQKIMYSDVLLLDELGRSMKTKTKLAESTFDDVLRSRTNSGRPTFVTTNQTTVELSEGYGGAIMSLLSERSIQFQVKGRDYRPEANERMMREVMGGESRPIF